jgi:hypothetical protein
MSTQWRCAVCESVNDGGETCAVCGAPRTEAAAPATPVSETPTRNPPRQDEREAEIPVRRLPARQPASETADEDERYDLYDYFNVGDRADADERYAIPEGYEARPRVRVYGCCLPLVLGMLLVFLGTATVLANLLVRAL